MTAPTIIYCWEFGAGLGHVISLQTVAKYLQPLGARSILVNPRKISLSNTAPFTEHLEFPNTDALKAPTPIENEAAISYNATVKSFGYGDAKLTFMRLNLWKRIFAEHKPSLVIGDYAPTAMLAATGLGIPTVAMGNGYTLPPANINSYPRFVDQIDPVKGDDLLVSLNQALKLSEMKQIKYLPEIFKSDIHACFTQGELDPFAKIRTSRAIGPIFAHKPPKFHPREANRIFVYLTDCRDETRNAVLTACSKIARPVDIYALNASPNERAKAAGSNLNFLDNRLSLKDICDNYCLAIHLGGHNFTMEFLYAGMPQLLLPKDMEKILLAQSMENLGLAHQLRVDHNKSADAIAVKIDQALSDQKIIKYLQAFSEKNNSGNWHDNLDQLRTDIERLIWPAGKAVN